MNGLQHVLAQFHGSTLIWIILSSTERVWDIYLVHRMGSDACSLAQAHIYLGSTHADLVMRPVRTPESASTHHTSFRARHMLFEKRKSTYAGLANLLCRRAVC